jgi:hypothetical protein
VTRWSLRRGRPRLPAMSAGTGSAGGARLCRPLPDVRGDLRDRLGRRRRAVGWWAHQLVGIVLLRGSGAGRLVRWADRSTDWAVAMGLTASERRAGERLATVWLRGIAREAELAEQGDLAAARQIARRLLRSVGGWRQEVSRWTRWS